MKKYIFKIIIIALLLTPFISKALSAYTLSAYTDDAGNITYTTATLNGHGGTRNTYPEGCTSSAGYSTTIANTLCNTGNTASTLQATAYFRYSSANISPIFCNDIYGSNMIATGDIFLGVANDGTCTYGGTSPNCYPPTSQSFSQNITGLAPNTTYYYCAIISDKNNIAYGGNSAVRSFHTSPYGTTITTTAATDIGTNSATINGSYSSVEDVTTSFQWKPMAAAGTSTNWNTVGTQKYSIGDHSNIYGDLHFPLTKTSAFDENQTVSGLLPNTTYQFRTVATTSSNTQSGTIYGSTLSFTTNPNPIGTGGGSKDTTSTTNSGYNNNSSNSNNNNSIINTNNTTPLALGQTATPPVDDVVRYHEGIETVFTREIVGDTSFATMYGYKTGNNLQTFAENLADQFARAFGYVSATGKEIRVSKPDVAAYQLQFSNNVLTVYEYYNNKIIDVRNLTTVFKNASGYEYYFKK